MNSHVTIREIETPSTADHKLCNIKRQRLSITINKCHAFGALS